MGDRQLTGKTGAHCTACRQQSRVERVLSRHLCLSHLQAAWLGWFLLLLGSCLVSRVFSDFVLLRVPFEVHLLTLAGRGLLDPVSSRDFLKLFGVGYFPT